VAFSTKSQGVEYALEGSVFIAGAAVQWLRDGLKIIKKASEVEELARRVPDSGGVVFVPALVGLGAPYWRSDARGVIAGITRGTTAEHIARATLEGIAMSVADLVEAMNADLKEPISEIGVDGGAASNNLLMELQADFAGVTLRRPKMLETTAFGAGLLAGLGIKLWSGREDLSRLLPVERRFTPQLSPELKERKREEWKRIVAKA
jgi:glycerol kinase